MKISKFLTSKLAASSFSQRVAWGILPVAIGVSFFAFGSGSPPSIPAISLANEPLYAATVVDKPAMALALSVEFPTVGAQYAAPVANATTDNSYSNTGEYLGYYDAEACYRYNDAPTETPASGLSIGDYKRFDRIGPATNRQCTDAFSGNFLNWASSSAIDMLRLALSGGDRYIDTDQITILQRAVLPNGDPICMWNSTNFAGKQLSRNGGGTNKYWGAVPAVMITAANGNDIWVANTLNKIFFGTSKAGNCTSTSAYTLGNPTSTASIGDISDSTNALPSDAVSCANNGATCSFTGVKEVWYGATKNGTSKYKVAPASGGVLCAVSVFADPYPNQTKKCYIRPYSGEWTPPPDAGKLNSDGFFYARVQVCNKSGGTLQDVRDYNLCRQYPNGTYKPTGVIQKYSDQIRLAAFGYLLDQTASYNSGGRYGGVLRAPMKYVGQKTFDIYGQDNTPTSGNPAAEWDAVTGIFKSNPDGDTSVTPNISGVINYLNKFGRTGTPGIYKKYDPIGELHYETLRYLQGLSPSADAISNITAAYKDGYPVYTTWSDPYGDGRTNTADYSCLKSNIVVIGDINTHDGNRLPAKSDSNNIPDINYWRGIVQAFEKNSGTSYLDGQGVSRTAGNPNGANNSVPSATSTSQIMGAAYWAHTHDIRGAAWSDAAKRRPGLRVKTFVFDVNEYGAQNTASVRRTSNQLFMAAKYGGFESDPANLGGDPYNTFGNPFKRQDGTNDNNVWQKTSDPGEAGTYYLQSSARGVLSAFDDIFGRASTAARSIAGSSASSREVSATVGSTIYSAKFDTRDWSGDVVAEPISFNNSTHQLSYGTPLWSASDKLAAMTTPATNRKIVMGRSGGDAAPVATDFTWSEIDATLKTKLNKISPDASEDGLGEIRLNYLRGDRSKESNPFRARGSLLGDIVNSSVVYSGIPSVSYSGASYSAFRTAYKNRTPAVFAGANDGMLHAFNAGTGSELFAYIPSWMGSKLSALTNPSFVGSHQNYVDAPPVVGEAQVAFNGGATDWKTVLVSGTGSGGSGVFALDVSNPSSFSASNVMWEFTRADDVDMGYVVGQPKILKFKTSTTDPTYRWFAVVASGVNNYVPDSTGLYSSEGKPALFLLALDKAAGSSWVEGSNYFKISIPVDSVLKATKPTGLINFTPLYGGSGEVSNIYMGDLHGKLWRIQFAGKAAADWTMDKISFFNKGTATSPSPYPMYIAKDGSGVVQPITAAPTLFQGPIVGGIDSYYVVFATGKFLEPSDKSSVQVNSMYAIYDNNSSAANKNASPIEAAISGRGRLNAGTVNTSTRTVTVLPFKWGRATSNSDSEQRSGWYFDLPVTSERAVSSIGDLGGYNAVFNTIIPGTSGGEMGSCTNTLGASNQYTMKVVSGSATYQPSSAGLLGSSLFFSNPDETQVSNQDSTGRATRTTIRRRINPGSTGLSTDDAGVEIKETIGRLSWRQINNYNDIKN